jgi:hypothetical protein
VKTQAEDHSLEEVILDEEGLTEQGTMKKIYMIRMIITMSHLKTKEVAEMVAGIRGHKMISMELVLIQPIVMLK